MIEKDLLEQAAKQADIPIEILESAFDLAEKHLKNQSQWKSNEQFQNDLGQLIIKNSAEE